MVLDLNLEKHLDLSRTFPFILNAIPRSLLRVGAPPPFHLKDGAAF
jgi:hypothetical protein